MTRLTVALWAFSAGVIYRELWLVLGWVVGESRPPAFITRLTHGRNHR